MGGSGGGGGGKGRKKGCKSRFFGGCFGLGFTNTSLFPIVCDSPSH